MAMNQPALKKLGVPDGRRTILCLDGGGIRGIMTLQLLKKLEEVAGAPCHEIFDLVAGTSTGGIIAGLIATGRTATEIEDLYQKLVKKVFQSAGPFANRFVNPPRYTKKSYRALLKDVVGADTTLAAACLKNQIDLLITAKDVAEGEETFFGCLVDEAGTAVGTYKDTLLRGVMETTMSAPTYFSPLERFVDGGVTTYNNPALAAILEAVQYGPAGKYNGGELTVFSFGTGYRNHIIEPRAVADPKGPDVVFWLSWLMSEAGSDASDMQSDLLRSRRLLPQLDYRRFQISLDHDAIHKLPNRELKDVDETDADWLYELKDEELAGIELDNVGYFPVMQVIGQAFAQFVMEEAARRKVPPFSFDLVDDRGRELLVTRAGDVPRIKQQMGSTDWLDGYRD